MTDKPPVLEAFINVEKAGFWTFAKGPEAVRSIKPRLAGFDTLAPPAPFARRRNPCRQAQTDQ
ncbi:hypothetical protein [Roseovarius sp.]|uniref:hypothetical protein n=1 Tax=Roseovarius sp. TaxID=1486281 RepID=UPI003B598D44